MKRVKIFFFLFFFLVVGSTISLAKEHNNKYLKEFIQVWGVCKHYHPNSIDGTQNIDKLFIDYYHLFRDAKNQKKANILFDKFFLELGQYDSYSNEDLACDYSKIHQLISCTSYSKKNKSQLKKLLKPIIQAPYFVDFSNKAKNPIFISQTTSLPFPNEATRIFGLANFWNTIYYYYPYLNLLPFAWEDKLEFFLLNLMDSKSFVDYHTYWELILLSLGDNHSSIKSFVLDNIFGYFYCFGQLRYIENHFVFHQFYSDSLALINNLRKGDILLEVNERPVDSIISRYRNLLKEYDSNAFRRKIGSKILRTKEDNIHLTICRNNDTLSILCNQYSVSDLMKYRESEQRSRSSIKYLNDSVIYLDTRIDIKHDLKNILEEHNTISHIIIDLRGPTNWIKPMASSNFYPNKKQFGKWFTSVPTCPGTFESKIPLEVGPEKFNNNYFKGFLYLLVNEFTQSQGEFQCMFLQIAPRVYTIGSKTAGSDGNISNYSIPGGIELRFSGAGIEYLDGTQCQYLGVSIDYFIKPTTHEIRQEIDPELNFALKLTEQALQNINK